MEFTGRIAALKHPQYRRFWLGSFASVGATQLQIMGLGWLLFELTGSALMLGYLGAASALPAIGMTLFGGVLADRVDKRLLLMVTSMVVALLLILLAVLDVTDLIRAWHIILIAGLISFVSGFDWPTRQAIFPQLIERQETMSAVALNSIIWQSCRMIMPAFGGVLLAVSDTSLIFLLCGAGFFAMFLVMSTIRIDTVVVVSSIESTLGQIREGLNFVYHNGTFFVLISLSYASMFFISSFMQLMPAFSNLLDAGGTGYGYLISMTGVGSVLGTLLVGSWQQSRHLGLVMLGATFMSGVTMFLFAWATGSLATTSAGFPLALLAALLVSLFSSVFLITSMTVLQLEVPDALRGRVMGIHSITYSLMPLGGLVTGALATLTSAPVAVSLAAGVYLLIVMAIAMSQAHIRRIDGSKLAVA